MAAHGQGELADIDIGRDQRPMPANIELFVGCEDTLVENFKRGFQKRWPGPLQDHGALLRKAGGEPPRNLSPEQGTDPAAMKMRIYSFSVSRHPSLIGANGPILQRLIRMSYW